LAIAVSRRRFGPPPSEAARMRKRRSIWAALMALAVSIGLVTPSQAITGSVRVIVAKAGLVVGAGAGRGILTFRHRNYPFTVRGLSLGVTAGASVSKLVGRASYINELGDFSGSYSMVGGGAAVVGGVSAVQLKNDKGVIITLQGPKAGLEVAANISSVVIVLDQSRSTQN
jgi:hypothetical protein